MKLLLGVVALLFAAASASDVVDLTEDTFDEFIESNKYVLAEFYAPWCGHCKKLAPEFEKAATTLKKDGVALAAIDATEEKDLGSRFGVRGFPTLKWFVDGVAQEYKGGRSEDTIVSWCKKKTGPPAATLADADAITSFAEENKVAVVGFFESESKESKAFIKAASQDDEHAYGMISDSGAAEANGVTAPAIVIFKQFDEGKNVFEGKYTSRAIGEFVAENSVPLVTPFTMEAAQQIFSTSTGKLGFLFSKKSMDGFADMAKEFKGKMIFSTSDGSVDRLNQHVGISASDMPIFTFLELGQAMVKYPLEDETTVDNIRTHIKSVLAGEATPYFKSEPIPEDNNEPVTVVVGKNFEDIVMDKEKDVLLEVYAPWCGHCKKLTPIWDELGEEYADNANVVIAKMDGTANEAEGLSVRGFPTIKFYAAGATSPKDYDGDRTLEGFKAFLKKNGKAKAGQAKDEL